MANENLVAILSDSHDNIPNIKWAIDEIVDRKVAHLLHGGDIVSPFVLENFRDLNTSMNFVYGNNDGERRLLEKKAIELEISISDLEEVKINGKFFCLYHGTNPVITDALLKSQKYDILITGHTHKKIKEVHGNTLHINPGELSGYLSGKSSFAILDINTLNVEFFEP